MATASVDKRLEALEKEVDQLKRKLARPITGAAHPWWQAHFGVFENSPYFEDAMMLGAQYRKDQPTPQDEIKPDVSS